VTAVDTNVLVYAHRADSEWHEPALRHMLRLAGGGERWGIPWPCVHEFIAVVTHPRIYVPATPLQKALAAMEVWLGSPACVALGEGPGYFGLLAKMCRAARLSGPMVHDARIAAICVHNGVRVLWTADRDFSRYPDLVVKNPLLE
jgi:toxin-antitoxin system PIN domain toxin